MEFERLLRNEEQSFDLPIALARAHEPDDFQFPLGDAGVLLNSGGGEVKLSQ